MKKYKVHIDLQHTNYGWPPWTKIGVDLRKNWKTSGSEGQSTFQAIQSQSEPFIL